MSDGKTTELELKFEMDVGELKALQASAAHCAELISEPVSCKLRSIYFDTSDHSLRAAGVALRVRDVEGRWVQTVKAKMAVRGGLSNPIEDECAIAGPSPEPAQIADPELREQVEAIAQSQLLLPVFETLVERTRFHLRKAASDGGASGEAELAIDIGHIYSDKGLDPIGEAELELLSGDAEILLHFATHLFAGRHFKLASNNKAARGYALIGAADTHPPEPRTARLPTIDKTLSIDAAFTLMVDADDRDDPSQLACNRGERRTGRTASIARWPAPAAQLAQGLPPCSGHSRLCAIWTIAPKRWRRLVGRLRDVDVLVDDIYAPVALKKNGEPKRREWVLAERLKRFRKLQRSCVRQELQHWPYASYRLELALFTHIAPWRQAKSKRKGDKPITSLSAKSLDKSYKRSQRWGKRLRKLSLAERHSMRKSLKVLRYQSEIFASLYRRKKIKRFSKRLRDLQDIFGYLNDVAMAGRLATMAQHAGATGSKDGKIVRNVLRQTQEAGCQSVAQGPETLACL